jgi:hypothetical protein
MRSPCCLCMCVSSLIFLVFEAVRVVWKENRRLVLLWSSCYISINRLGVCQYNGVHRPVWFSGNLRTFMWKVWGSNLVIYSLKEFRYVATVPNACSHGARWSSGKAVDSYSRNDRFESQPGHCLSRLRFPVVFLSLSSQYLSVAVGAIFQLPSRHVEIKVVLGSRDHARSYNRANSLSKVFQPWRLRQHFLPKHRCPSSRLHSDSSQKMKMWKEYCCLHKV